MTIILIAHLINLVTPQYHLMSSPCVLFPNCPKNVFLILNCLNRDPSKMDSLRLFDVSFKSPHHLLGFFSFVLLLFFAYLKKLGPLTYKISHILVLATISSW